VPVGTQSDLHRSLYQVWPDGYQGALIWQSLKGLGPSGLHRVGLVTYVIFVCPLPVFFLPIETPSRAAECLRSCLHPCGSLHTLMGGWIAPHCWGKSPTLQGAKVTQLLSLAINPAKFQVDSWLRCNQGDSSRSTQPWWPWKSGPG
jgi:hypothetical protein